MKPTFAFSMEEIAEELEKSRAKKETHQICKCGHQAGRHTSEGNSAIHRELRASGHFHCTVGRYTCPCKKFEPVMETKDARRFTYKTEGAGAKHALSKGAFRTWEAGIEVHWIDGVSCDGCKAQGIALHPVALTANGLISDRATERNYLVCDTCKTRLEQPHGESGA